MTRPSISTRQTAHFLQRITAGLGPAMVMEGSSPSKLVLLLVLLAPLLEARTLGGFCEQLHLPLMLPSDGAVLRRPKLNALGVGRPYVPPAPKPDDPRHPLQEQHGGSAGVSRRQQHVPPAPKPDDPRHGLHEPHGGSAGVSRRQQHAPPPPKGHTPPHDPRTGPPRRAAGALRVLWDAIRYVI